MKLCLIFFVYALSHNCRDNKSKNIAQLTETKGKDKRL